MRVSDIVLSLEQLAPSAYQESYDNAQLITGSMSTEVTGVLCALDCTEEVIEEAIEKGCNMVVAHHPIVFSGLKSLTGKNYVERTVIKAIKNDVAVFASHTNLDSVQNGVNFEIAKRLSVKNPKILSPKKSTSSKVIVFVPQSNADAVEQAMFNAGGGTIGDYEEVSFKSEGIGAFKAKYGAAPHVGEVGERHFEPEHKIEMLVEKHKVRSVINAMIQAHPYEEVAYDVIGLENYNTAVGIGVIGELEKPVPVTEFFDTLKQQMKVPAVRHTPMVTDTVSRIAICGGSGSFLIKTAMSQGADVLVTGDVKYHEFFDADGKLIIADIGHFESEQYTSDLLVEYLREKFSTFAVYLSDTRTNPVNYYI